MTPIPGVRDMVRQSLYPVDGRDGEELQGATLVLGELPRVREGIAKGFIV